jgi:tRNA-dihydrouridine synthase
VTDDPRPRPSLGFWEALARPFSVLAPMEEVTDTVFRRVVCMAGAPDVFFTEFANADELASTPRIRSIRRLTYTEQERPIVAQLWGTKPEGFLRMAARLRGMGFDGVDLNMGCPVRNVIARGAGGALIRNPALAAELVAAAREGAGPLPLSIKTRIGFDSPRAEAWLGHLLAQGIAALTVHGRTVEQQSGGKADWSAVALAVRMRDEAGLATRVVGNGDVGGAEAFWSAARSSGADGVMVGRGVFADIEVFRSIRGASGGPDARPRAWYLRAHLDLHRETWGEEVPLDMAKRIARNYLRSGGESAPILDAFLHARSYRDARALLDAPGLTVPQAKR